MRLYDRPDRRLFIDHEQGFDENSYQLISPHRTYNTTCMSNTFNEGYSAHYHAMLRGEEHHQVYARELRERVRSFRNKIAAQLKSDSRSYRIAHMSRTDWKRVPAYFKDYAMGVLTRDDDLLFDTLQSLRDCAHWAASEHLMKVHKEKFQEIVDVANCSDCGGIYRQEDLSYFESCDDYVCDSCRDDHYVYSGCQCQYIHEDNAYSVFDSVRAYRNDSPNDYCTTRYGERNFHRYDDAYFSDYNDYRAVSGEEDEDEEGYLASWHNAYREFRDINADNDRPSIGMELEVYAEDRREVVIDLRDSFSQWKLILEKDGSLDDYCGFEIITQPMGFKEWDKFVPSLSRKLKEYAVVGYNEPAGEGYGIHLTIHRKHFSPLAEARIAMFLTAKENADFVRAIAQRNQIYSASYGVGIGHVDNVRVNAISDGLTANFASAKGKTKIFGKGKYCPVNWKDNLAEFRIFQSTTNPSSMMKNLEFVWALHAWTKVEAATGNSWHHTDFLKWLNSPQQRQQYPQLCAFLSKRTYYGTNFEPIRSTWQTLMVKPVDEDTVESTIA